MKLIETVGNLAVMCLGKENIALSIKGDMVVLHYGEPCNKQVLACHYNTVELIEAMKNIIGNIYSI